MSYLNYQNQTVATLLAAQIYYKAAKKDLQNEQALVKTGE